MDTEKSWPDFDKILLSVLWVIALGSTLYVAYKPPQGESQLLQTMLTLVTSVLSALLVLINGPKKEQKQ